MGCEGDVTEQVDLEEYHSRKRAKVKVVYQNDKADYVVSNKNNYKNHEEFLKAFFHALSADIFIGVNQYGNVSFDLYYRGNRILSQNHKNGCTISTK